jgi:hypothetical protein
MFKPLAKKFAQSAILKSGRLLWKQNQKDINLPLKKLEKIIIGMYLITNDYVEGLFPPTFNDQQKAYEAEIAYRFSLPGVSVSSARDSEMRKPFWFGKYGSLVVQKTPEILAVQEVSGWQGVGKRSRLMRCSSCPTQSHHYVSSSPISSTARAAQSMD